MTRTRHRLPQRPRRLAKASPIIPVFLILVLIGGMTLGFFQLRNEPESGQSQSSSAVHSEEASSLERSDLTNQSKGQFTSSTETSSSEIHPLDEVLELARDGLKQFTANYRDYTATMFKRERIRGRLGEENQMFVKIINRLVSESDGQLQTPMHVYLRFDAPSSVKGREVIWVEGQNDNKLIAHEAGFFNLASVHLAPDGTLAMMGNKYPITDIGIANLFTKLIEKGERDRNLGICEVHVEEGFEVHGVNCQRIQVIHHEKKPEYDFHIAEIFFDIERMIPLKYASYGWPAKPDQDPPLEEEYSYADLQLNVDLTEDDFDPKNPAYKFP